MSKLIPNSFQVPNELIDEHLGRNIDLQEFAILAVIIRKTRGWHKESDGISINQFRKFSGIKSKATIIDRIEKLEKKGFIQKVRTYATNGGYSYSLYSLGEQFSPAKSEISSDSEMPPLVHQMNKGLFMGRTRACSPDEHTKDTNTKERTAEPPENPQPKNPPSKKKHQPENLRPSGDPSLDDEMKKNIDRFLTEWWASYPTRNGEHYTVAETEKFLWKLLPKLKFAKWRQILNRAKQYKSSKDAQDGFAFYPIKWLTEVKPWQEKKQNKVIVEKQQRQQTNQKQEEQKQREEAERLEVRYKSLPQAEQERIEQEALSCIMKVEHLRHTWNRAKSDGENPLDRPMIRAIYLSYRNQILANGAV